MYRVCAMCHIKKIGNLQSVILRTILNAAWYVRNDDIKKILKIPIVEVEIKRYSKARQHRIKKTRKTNLIKFVTILAPNNQRMVWYRYNINFFSSDQR
jgi:hypothetical protein